MDSPLISRRDVVIAGMGAAAIAVSGFATVIYKAGFSQEQLDIAFGDGAPSDLILPPTRCSADGSDAASTPNYSEGPFYSPRSPFKPDLREAGFRGDEMVLSGRVVDTSCNPVPGAVLDFWQVDDQARYDNAGDRYRGHVFTDRDGVFQMRSVHPVPYSTQGFWQTAHLHVKVQGPGTRLLTTQLFFTKFEAENAQDSGWTADLEVAGGRGGDGVYDYRFDFVLAPA